MLYNIQITRDAGIVVENFLSLDLLITRRKLTDIMLVYDILNNLINFSELSTEISFLISCRNTRKSDVFAIYNYK